VDVFIYDAVRTPRGKAGKGGSLKSVSPVDLAATVLRAIRDRNALDTSRLDDVILGCVEAIGDQGSDIARTAVLMADFDERVPGVQLNRYCASGLEAVNSAAAQIACGQSDVTIAGGVESLSRIPILAAGGAVHSDPKTATKTGFIPQGVAADLVATIFGFSRTDVDAYAAASQERASTAQAEHRFDKSIVPVSDECGLLILDNDESIRQSTTMQSLGALEPSFEKIGSSWGFDDIAIQRYPDVERINHVHHAGNSSGIADGAAAVLLGSSGFGDRTGAKPRARIRAFASVGSEPTIMLTGPYPASQKALEKAGMTFSDIDLFEVNEAFAAVPLHFMRETGVGHDRINVNGGAIAMGHPLGASGSILLGTVLDELERRNLSTALVTLCVGAGMGTATIIERV
jgi:acetyl-CoA C-acetyltransferase